MAKMTANFEILCIQYHSDIDGIHNIAAFTKWNEWERTCQIVDNVEAPDFGVIDDRILSVAVDTFFEYGRMAFEGADYMEDEGVREMFDDYVENCFTDKTVTFCKWTKVKVDVRVEVVI